VIVLDTHAWIWWVSDPDRIPPKALRLIDRTMESGVSLLVSSISTWEVAMLVDRGRLELRLDVSAWIAASEVLPFIEFVPVDNAIALRAVQLREFPHRDPADRLIVATALGLGAALITGDTRLRAYRPAKTVWD
jgi:PIN domain nuclease of toxin-antitoxin system